MTSSRPWHAFGSTGLLEISRGEIRSTVTGEVVSSDVYDSDFHKYEKNNHLNVMSEAQWDAFERYFHSIRFEVPWDAFGGEEFTDEF